MQKVLATRRMTWAGGPIRFVTLAALGLLLLILPACGSSAESGASGAAGEEAAPSGRGDVPESGGGEAAGAEQGEMAAAGAAQAGDEVGAAGGFDRKIIKTAELGVRVDNAREGAAEAQRIAAEFGGSTLNSRVNRGGESVSARLVLLVPSAEFEAALDALRGLGEVTTDAVRGEDVTEEFVDLEARERNLLAAEEGLLRLFDEAENVEAALSVRRELTEVRGEIEQVRGRLDYLQQRADLSSIELNVRPVVAAQNAAWEPGRVAARAWDASLDVLQAGATAIISAVVFSWWLLPVMIAGWIGYKIWRRNHPPATPEPEQETS